MDTNEDQFTRLWEDHTDDRLGRAGIAIGYLEVASYYAEPDADANVAVLIADPHTGALLGAERIDVTGARTDVPPPSMVWFQSFLPARAVTDLGALTEG